MFIYLVKRVLPFILTLIFGIGVGSIFGGGTSTQVAPNFAPARTYTYKGCSSRRRNFEDHSRSSQNEHSTPTRNDPTLIAR
jgi:hypothetical protein